MQWNLEESDLTMAPADGLDTEYRSAGPGAGLALRLMGPERLYVGNTASLGLVDHSFTIEAWIKIADWADHDQTIVGRYCHPNTLAGTPKYTTPSPCHLRHSGNVGEDIAKNETLHVVLRQRCLVFGFLFNDIVSPDPLELRTWTHIACRYDLDRREQSLFVDGDMVARTANHAPLTGNVALHLNRFRGNSESHSLDQVATHALLPLPPSSQLATRWAAC